jgi:uncharacterized protein YijF (DUF1287 family)
LIAVSFDCGNKTDTTKLTTTKSGDTLKPTALSRNQLKVLAGANRCLNEKFRYDSTMAYHTLTFENKIDKGQAVYPLGDLDSSTGVCVEVTIRALRYGGIVDLQEAIHEDVVKNWKDYPMSRWNAKAPDANIDHRRVPNQLVWFKKNWDEVKEGFQPGDVVVWDMDGDSWGDHIGILSETYNKAGDNLLVIHNFPSPGYVAREDVLNKWKIIGHFRIKSETVK